MSLTINFIQYHAPLYRCLAKQTFIIKLNFHLKGTDCMMYILLERQTF